MQTRIETPTAATVAASERRIALPGTFNFRDVGGYTTADGRTTRWRTLFRSDALFRLDDLGRGFLRSAHVHTILDLREIAEASLEPDRLEGTVCERVAIPLYDWTRTRRPEAEDGTYRLSDLYLILVQKRGAALADAVAALARPGALPAVVHCSLGKDRTGLVIALALSLVGVRDEEIIDDFAESARFLDDVVRAELEGRAQALLGSHRLTDVFSASPELIRAALGEIRRVSGDVESFLIDHGLDRALVPMLCTALLDGSRAA